MFDEPEENLMSQVLAVLFWKLVLLLLKRDVSRCLLIVLSQRVMFDDDNMSLLRYFCQFNNKFFAPSK
jgi:hypothetical protein